MIQAHPDVKREPPAPAVADPRRSYDRGIWVGALASDDKTNGDKPIDITTVSFEELRRELDRREKGLEALIAKRAKVAVELAALDTQIRELEGDLGGTRPAPARSGRKQPAKLVLPRAKNSINLPDAIALAVEPRAVISPAEAAKLVLANGYQTTATKFAMVVANALSKDDRFKRVGRGRYERVV